MKKIRLIFFFILLFAANTFTEKEMGQRSLSSVTEPEKTSFAPVKRKSLLKLKLTQQKDNRFVLAKPQDLTHFEISEDIHMTSHHVLIKGLGATPRTDYKPSMGEIISQNEHFIFLKKRADLKLSPVAYSKSDRKLYPISYVLHVHDASLEKRDLLLRSGYKQYYYHSGIQLLSIESTPQRVLNDYQTLQKRGFKVQLEVVKPHQEVI